MRTSLVLLCAGAVASGACVVGSVTAVRAQEAAATRASSVDEDTLKDAEIMRRVLVREALGSRNALSPVLHYGESGSTNLGWSYGASAAYAECFIVPAQGATFILRTSDPVTGPRGTEEPAAATPEPTAWDEEAAAIDGKPVRPKRSAKGAGFEAAKVEALRNRVIEQLAKYGAKIRGLAPSDSLTVIVQGGAGRLTAPVAVTSNGAPDVSAELVRTATLRLGYVNAEARTVLVIRATVADCKAAADGSISADEFRRRAAISSY
jgi:hypothetical protein